MGMSDETRKQRVFKACIEIRKITQEWEDVYRPYRPLVATCGALWEAAVDLRNPGEEAGTYTILGSGGIFPSAIEERVQRREFDRVARDMQVMDMRRQEVSVEGMLTEHGNRDAANSVRIYNIAHNVLDAIDRYDDALKQKAARVRRAFADVVGECAVLFDGDSAVANAYLVAHIARWVTDKVIDVPEPSRRACYFSDEEVEADPLVKVLVNQRLLRHFAYCLNASSEQIQNLLVWCLQHAPTVDNRLLAFSKMLRIGNKRLDPWSHKALVDAMTAAGAKEKTLAKVEKNRQKTEVREYWPSPSTQQAGYDYRMINGIDWNERPAWSYKQRYP